MAQGQDYIRWFEPFVNSAMKRYTVTANYKIQLETIAMLQALVSLRVNYSLLDPEGVFLRVLRGQIEFSEKLVWRDADKVLPKIFQFFVQISDDSKSNAVIKRNEVITLLSQLMAAGVVQDGIINSIYHLVKHIFNVQNRGEHILLEAEREMLFSIILKMIENAKVFPLLNHILVFYKSCDQVGWRSTSARVTRAVLTQCVPKQQVAELQCKQFDNFSQISQILENCSNGSLIQNEKLIFDVLRKNQDVLESPFSKNKINFVLINISLLRIIFTQSGLRQIVITRQANSASKTDFLKILKRILTHASSAPYKLKKWCRIQTIFLAKMISGYL